MNFLMLPIIIAEAPENMKRKAECGPSQSITKPMAEAIVREINKRGTPNKIVKLDSLKNLPYTLVGCEKEVLKINPFGEKGVQFKSNQTCYFQDDKKYLVRLRYKGFNRENKNLNMKTGGRLYIYISKANLDFTEVEYGALRYIRNNNKTIHTNKWNISSIQINYSKKTKGLCRYKRGIRF